jgi:hypothetical protein
MAPELVKLDDKFIAELTTTAGNIPKRIRSQVQYQQVSEDLHWFTEMARKIKAKYAPFKRSALDHLNLLRKSEKDDLEKCEPYEQVCQTLIAKWEQDQEEKSRHELDATMEEAEKTAAAEREQQLSTLAEQIDTAPESAKGVLSGVRETLRSQPLAVEYASVKQPYRRPQGHSVRAATYRADVVNLASLVKAIVSGHADLDCVVPNQTYLNGRARREKDMLRIPGVTSVCGERKTTVRTR